MYSCFPFTRNSDFKVQKVSPGIEMMTQGPTQRDSRDLLKSGLGALCIYL